MYCEQDHGANASNRSPAHPIYQWLCVAAVRACYYLPRARDLLAPKASGFLYIRGAKRAGLDHAFVEKGNHLYNEGTGTRDVVQMIALGAALEFHQAIGAEVIHRRILDLRDHAQQVFGAIPGLTPYSSDHPALKSGLVTFWVDQAEASPGKVAELARDCLREGVTLKGLTDFGTPLLRLTPHVYNSQAQIERAGEFVRNCLGA